MRSTQVIKPVAAVMAFALSAIAVAQTAPRYAVVISPWNADRDGIGNAVESVPSDWKNMQTNAVRVSVGSPNPIGFYSGRSTIDFKTGVDAILVKDRGRWRPVWFVHSETNGRSTCAQVMAHVAKGHAIARQYVVDPDLFSAQFQNWERSNRSALAKGGRGCTGSVV
jgi:hypothetical protein